MNYDLFMRLDEEQRAAYLNSLIARCENAEKAAAEYGACWRRADALLALSSNVINSAARMVVINDLRDKAHAHAVSAGLLRRYANVHDGIHSNETARRAALAQRIGDEVAEAVEASAESTERFAEELADIILTTLTVAGEIGVDIGEALESKRKYNETRGWMHGKVES